MELDKNKQIAIIIISIVIFFGLFFLYKFKRDERIKGDGVYVIAKITNQERVYSSGINVYYQYEYKNNLYKGKDKNGAMTDDLIGRKYFLIVDTNSPNDNILLFDYPVPFCITENPPEGWKEIPKCK